MPSTDRNDLMPAQEKLEWVTPKIPLMVAGETDGTNKPANNSETPIADPINIGGYITAGPS